MSNASWVKDEYLVAVKLLLRDGNKLLITHDTYGQWDVPGGRIRKDQFDVSDEDILQEKVRLELGPELEYSINGIKTTMRISRKEHGRDNAEVKIYGIGYEATYLGGDIILGESHDEYRWIDLTTTDLKEIDSSSGWMSELVRYQRDENKNE